MGDTPFVEVQNAAGDLCHVPLRRSQTHSLPLFLQHLAQIHPPHHLHADEEVGRSVHAPVVLHNVFVIETPKHLALPPQEIDLIQVCQERLVNHFHSLELACLRMHCREHRPATASTQLFDQTQVAQLVSCSGVVREVCVHGRELTEQMVHRLPEHAMPGIFPLEHTLDPTAHLALALLALPALGHSARAGHGDGDPEICIGAALRDDVVNAAAQHLQLHLDGEALVKAARAGAACGAKEHRDDGRRGQSTGRSARGRVLLQPLQSLSDVLCHPACHLKGANLEKH
mmetsp:Transcript_42123/g.111224  ORF Transcript_42123/g.111224 Transcript_42123/m.111224 type:complete len:286 (+) Transcript_42123:1108-1965(+)